jgi:hypothetical protein
MSGLLVADSHLVANVENMNAASGIKPNGKPNGKSD